MWVSIDEDNVEEECCLAWVAITRSRQALTMTLASKRKQYGEIIETNASRFLDDCHRAILNERTLATTTLS